MKIRLYQFASMIAAALFLAVLAGCATAAKPVAMKVEDLSLGKHFNKTVAVRTSGGNRMVSDKDLAQSISDSLRSSGLFSGVVGVDQADFVLNAMISNVNQPAFRRNLSVEVEIAWSLTPKGQSKPCWEKAIAARAEKTSADAHAIVKRFQLAIEAVVQENIRKALTELSQAQLPASN